MDKVIIGNDPRLLKALEQADRAGDFDCSVLITGETGTGKELIAERIHKASSKRRPGPFVTLNCSAVPKDLIESELFGHIKGSFTGAFETRAGLFEAADNGTIFLDEIGDMPAQMQLKLLRVLEDNRVKKVGSSTYKQVNVRIICATNRDLSDMIEKKEFRQDLFYRINVLPIELPPLRHRRADIPALANFFMAKISEKYSAIGRKSLTPQALEFLALYDWPGNIRELENFCESLYCLCRPDGLREQEVREYLMENLVVCEDKEFISMFNLKKWKDLEIANNRLKKSLLRATLRRNGGNVSQSAKDLGIDRKHLYNQLKIVEMPDLYLALPKNIVNLEDNNSENNNNIEARLSEENKKELELAWEKIARRDEQVTRREKEVEEREKNIGDEWQKLGRERLKLEEDMEEFKCRIDTVIRKKANTKNLHTFGNIMVSKKLFIKLMEKYGGNKQKIAKDLGIKLHNAYYLEKKFGLKNKNWDL